MRALLLLVFAVAACATVTPRDGFPAVRVPAPPEAPAAPRFARAPSPPSPAPRAASAPAAHASRLHWPVEPIDLHSGYGPRKDPLGGGERRHPFHAGLDLGAIEGQYVRSAAPGRVVRAGPLAGYGLTVVVQHGPALETIYAHLSTVDVFVGDNVRAGDPLGLAGATGRATGPHLHFEVRAQGRAVNPLTLLEPAP